MAVPHSTYQTFAASLSVVGMMGVVLIQGVCLAQRKLMPLRATRILQTFITPLVVLTGLSKKV
jgi:hypothetical protein